MVEIVFEPHSTSEDNEARLSSGWNDVALSPAGEQQAKEMGPRYAGQQFDAIFCSDLQRSYKTAQLAFGDKFPIVQDKRLRECGYGDMTQHDKKLVDAEKPNRVTTPFPNGESYEQCCARMAEFLSDLRRDYAGKPGRRGRQPGKRVMIIGHRATQYGLEHTILGKPIAEVVSAPWSWQPGWHYELGAL